MPEEITPAPPEDLVDPKVRDAIYFEYFSRQRAYFDAALKRAILKVGDLFYPNPYDYTTAVELCYLEEVGATFCRVVDPYGSQLGKTVTEIAERCLAAESTKRDNDRLIDDLRNEIHDLKLELRQVRGGKN